MTSKELLLQVLEKDVVAGAKAILGSTLRHGGLSATIIETEAYRGSDDPASHAFRGPTERNRVMFEEPGHAYVYFTYGNHWMLNVTALEPGLAGGILIRAAFPLTGLEEMRLRRSSATRTPLDRDLLSGPGKLAQAFGIDRSLNGVFMLDPASPLTLEAPDRSRPYLALPRVGIATGKGHETLWRFVDVEFLDWISPPRPKMAG